MLEIDGKCYKIDIDAFIEWVALTPVSERNVMTTTTINYPMTDSGEEFTEKEVSENKSTMNDVFSNIRYDVLRTLLNVLLTSYTNEMGSSLTFSLEDLTFGQRLAFNSLLAKNIIKEVNFEENE